MLRTASLSIGHAPAIDTPCQIGGETTTYVREQIVGKSAAQNEPLGTIHMCPLTPSSRAGYCRPTPTPGPFNWRLGMKCPRCQHENPPQAKFCLECGARVALTCTKCRSELPAGAKFCLE
jgi:Double zinc ribbon